MEKIALALFRELTGKRKKSHQNQTNTVFRGLLGSKNALRGLLESENGTKKTKPLHEHPHSYMSLQTVTGAYKPLQEPSHPLQEPPNRYRSFQPVT